MVYGAAALSIIVVTVTGALFIGAYRATPPSAPPPAFEGAGSPSTSSLDLSTMTPRAAADRLFNRVMGASERGDTNEAARFAPMAVQAYGRVADLDADAHYHLGLLYLQIGDLDGARRQIETLKQQVPQHLLALVLEREVAARAGDQAAVAQTTLAFGAAYEAEIAVARPEYEAHRYSIDQFRNAGSAPVADSAPVDRAVANPDAALFESRCAACHGVGAVGTTLGPPLVHRIYEPSHHGDESFYRAVREGVRSHHWQFGDMPPVAGVSDQEVGRIVAYVRALQKANGIE